MPHRPAPHPRSSPPPPPIPLPNTSRHLFFAVPPNGSQDAFAGQFLRLEEYVGSEEDVHLPASITSKTGLKGIAISSTGYFLVNAKLGVYETFGKALTEAIGGAGHTITIEKGDWTLTAEEGEISIEATNKGTPSTMSLVSTGSDIVFEALSGKASSSDKYDVKVSKANTVTFVGGFEYSFVNGSLIKENIGFVMNINVVGDISTKVFDIKIETFPFKYTELACAILFFSLKWQRIYFKFGIIDSKNTVVYNKLTTWQIYNEIADTKATTIKAAVKGMVIKDGLADAEKKAGEIGMWQLIWM